MLTHTRLKNGKTGIVHAMRTTYRTLCGLPENDLIANQKGEYVTGEITCGKCKRLHATRKASQ